MTFASRRPASGGAESGFALDGFQIDSLVDYLRGQADVRRALEAELQSDWKQVAAGKRAKGGGIWQHAEVRAVVLYRRHVPDPALLANMERLHGKRAVKDTIASADKPDTRSTFLVYVRLARQDYLAVFRDRALASFENL